MVACDRDFQPEFIESGVDGFIVPFRDHAAMAERALELIGRPELAASFSAAIRAKGLHHTDPEEVRAAEWRPYEEVLGRAG
jgi:glycosyltransferase involved in cell wall biosynthesis